MCSDITEVEVRQGKKQAVRRADRFEMNPQVKKNENGGKVNWKIMAQTVLTEQFSGSTYIYCTGHTVVVHAQSSCALHLHSLTGLPPSKMV